MQAAKGFVGAAILTTVIVVLTTWPYWTIHAANQETQDVADGR